MEIRFVAPDTTLTGTAAVAVFADRTLSGPGRTLDDLIKGDLGRAMAASPKFKGGRDEVLILPAVATDGLERVLLLGLGAPDSIDARATQRAGGTLAAHANQAGADRIIVHAELPDDGGASANTMAADLAYGGLLRAYRFDRYKTKQKPEAKWALVEMVFVCPDPAAAETAFKQRQAVADGVTMARDLVSEPPNILHPEAFADRCRSLADLGVEVEILDDAALQDLGMDALLGVGLGSIRGTRLAVMRWLGAADPSTPPIAFVGKGVTFDTGGISLKPSAGMDEMKTDMAGAAAVTGLMRAIAGRKAKANVIGVLGLVENMPSGAAQRPGDVVTSMSGQTIEVLNTDAEGRLVLADALWYTQDRFKPALMVDLATLTGAVLIALGQHKAGVFSNNDELAERLFEAGEAVGESLWRLPLGDAYNKDIDSDVADVKNIAGNRNAGSIIGAQFLQRFVNGVAWAHLDIAGVAWTKKDDPITPKGATGFGVRLLDRLVAEHYES